MIIKGRSGIGKTCLLETIAGLKKIKSGIIEFEILEDSGRKKIINFRAKNMIAFMNQNLNFDIIPGEKVSIKDWSFYSKKLKVYDVFKKIQKSSFRNFHEMSGGQKQRILLSRLISMNRNLLILDEPSSALDSKTIFLLKNLIEKEKRNKIFIIVTHSEDLAEIGNKFINMS